MKSLIIIAMLSAALAASAAPNEPHYKVKILNDYESVPLTELEGIIDCVVYDLGCTPTKDAIRAAYPEVMQNACEFCTDEQKRAAYHFYVRIIRDLPKKVQDLRKKYDPENKYYDNFFRALENSVQSENRV